MREPGCKNSLSPQAELINPKHAEWHVVIPAWLARRREVHGTAKLVYGKLAGYYNELKGVAWPGIKRLAFELGLDTRTVQRHLAALRKAGLIAVVRHLWQASSNGYVFLRHEWMGEKDVELAHPPVAVRWESHSGPRRLEPFEQQPLPWGKATQTPSCSDDDCAVEQPQVSETTSTRTHDTSDANRRRSTNSAKKPPLAKAHGQKCRPQHGTSAAQHTAVPSSDTSSGRTSSEKGREQPHARPGSMSEGARKVLGWFDVEYCQHFDSHYVRDYGDAWRAQDAWDVALELAELEASEKGLDASHVPGLVEQVVRHWSRRLMRSEALKSLSQLEKHRSQYGTPFRVARAPVEPVVRQQPAASSEGEWTRERQAAFWQEMKASMNE